MDWTLSVGQLAARSGVTVSTIRFYEAKGLIHSVRTSGNQRRFARVELRRVAVIKAAQRAGVSLGEIHAALAALPEKRAPSADDWKRLSARWRSELEARIAHLEALRDQLSDCIGCGCLSLKTCPLRNPIDRLARKGPGPHLLGA